VRAVRESDSYQAILDEGEVRGLQRAVLGQGRKKLGEPDEATRAALGEITDPDRLDRLIARLLDASTWQDLLQTS
jgi:hypothetical protein